MCHPPGTRHKGYTNRLPRRGQHDGQAKRPNRRYPSPPLPPLCTQPLTNPFLPPGWGQYLSAYLTIPVINKAIAGRSARSYTNEGRFTEIASLLKPDDIVVIEFGHNDGGSPTSSSDNGRSDCPGTGSETCKSGKDGSTVYTFGHYVEAAARTFIGKGARVILSSQTPNNVWEGGKYNDSPSRFVAYAATAEMYRKLGSAKVNGLYPKDHTHTSPEGADLVAQAFVQAVGMDWNGTTPLKGWLKTPVPVVF